MWRTTKPGGNLCSSVYVLFLFMSAKLSIAADTLTRGQSLQGPQTLTSKDGIFDLGFLSYSEKIYLGIWYKDFSDKTAVWMANREAPVLESSSSFKLEFSSDGNLGLFDGPDDIWSTSLMSIVPDSVEAVLLDNGNFILRDSLNPSTILWQSFDHPTDTWLPGATLGVQAIGGKTQRLVSWRNTDDPSPGLYSVEVSQDRYPEFVMMWNTSVRYWTSGGWNGIVFGSAPELSYLTNFSFVSNENETYFTYSLLNSAVFSRLVISPSGKLEQLTTLRGHGDWSAVTVQPKNQADVFGFCGAFGVYSNSPSNPCKCLHGFEPVETRGNEGFGGCSRISALQCGNSNSSRGNGDGFLRISDVGLPAYPKAHPARNAQGCASACVHNCTCVAYAFNESGCLIWDGSLFDLRFSDNGSNVLFLKLQDAKGKKKIMEIIVAVVVPILISGGLLGCFFTRRNKRKGNKDFGEDLLSFDFNYTDNPTNDGTNMGKGNVKDFDLPMFTYASASAATNNFSTDNKVGEGGYGPVYKGKLSNGQEVALKRLSKRSGQGFEEFRNEILLIAKLQHRNLVRLLGCCIDQDESILIYEYMTNKSLDFFLFDPNKQEQLDWESRIRIIEGIAQGILYLHEYSRLRIIHRDLKASNILLDGDLNPKISDFGMARIFGGNDSRTNTQRIVGTYGYMAPEYAMQGLFSIKSDVFSFGVLVLEIISGKKNTGFYNTDSLNLLGHAWELWISDRGAELKDSAVGSPQAAAVLRYINVGLLCVQENPNDRPNMSTVISMLSNEIAPLPAPNKPGFSISRCVKLSSTSSGNTAGNYSLNGLTISMIEPR